MTSSSDLLDRVGRLVGDTVVSSAPVEGGYTPATRLVCRTSRGQFFVKAGSTPLTSEFLRREIEVYRRITGPFIPRLIACEDHQTEPVLIIEDLSACYWPPPWTNQLIDAALRQMDAMHQVKAALEPYGKVHGSRPAGWTSVAQDPRPFLSLGIADEQWLRAGLPALLQNEARCPTEGDCLTHWDIRSDNMCFDGDRVILVDWNLACTANPRLDLGFWLPSLAFEGGPLPAEVLPDAPEVAAWVSGFFASRAGLPTIPDAPRVRQVQKQQLATALPWAVSALDLAPLPAALE